MQFFHSYLSIRAFNVTSNQKETNANSFKQKKIELNCIAHKTVKSIDRESFGFALILYLQLGKDPVSFPLQVWQIFFSPKAILFSKQAYLVIS